MKEGKTNKLYQIFTIKINLFQFINFPINIKVSKWNFSCSLTSSLLNIKNYEFLNTIYALKQKISHVLKLKYQNKLFKS